LENQSRGRYGSRRRRSAITRTGIGISDSSMLSTRCNPRLVSTTVFPRICPNDLMRSAHCSSTRQWTPDRYFALIGSTSLTRSRVPHKSLTRSSRCLFRFYESFGCSRAATDSRFRGPGLDANAALLVRRFTGTLSHSIACVHSRSTREIVAAHGGTIRVTSTERRHHLYRALPPVGRNGSSGARQRSTRSHRPGKSVLTALQHAPVRSCGTCSACYLNRRHTPPMRPDWSVDSGSVASVRR
jgi:hypothetical protein